MPETDQELFVLSGDLIDEESVPNPFSNSYPREIIEEVWESADAVSGNDAALWRRDSSGSLICRTEYGNRNSSFGWVIRETAAGRYSPNRDGQLEATHVDNV